MKKRRQSLRRSAPRAEAKLWFYLKEKKLGGYKFRRQYSIGGYVVDFYCPALRLAIEVDGPSHFASDEVIKYDKQRQHYIEYFGMEVLRVTNVDVYYNIDSVIGMILTYIPLT